MKCCNFICRTIRASELQLFTNPNPIPCRLQHESWADPGFHSLLTLFWTSLRLPLPPWLESLESSQVQEEHSSVEILGTTERKTFTSSICTNSFLVTCKSLLGWVFHPSRETLFPGKWQRRVGSESPGLSLLPASRSQSCCYLFPLLSPCASLRCIFEKWLEE